MRRFSGWLTDEGEQAADPLLGLKSPKLDEAVVQPLTDDQIRAMLKACRGPDLKDKRDEAILRLMFTSGARAGEVVALADRGPEPARRSADGTDRAAARAARAG